MKASEAQFRFPLLGFSPDPNLGELGYMFPDLESLTICRGYTLKTRTPDDLELVDAGGARWKVKRVEKRSRYGPLAFWLVAATLNWQRYRVEYDLEPLPAMTLADVQERVCAVEQAFGDLDDYTEEYAAETAARLAKIRKAKSIARVAKLAEWEGF
jgi:hypothetical protein